MTAEHDDRVERLRRRWMKPDGVVFKSDAAIVEFVKPYTIALVGPDGPGLGSGVLVQLWGHYFILTAGHVVREVERLGGPVNLVISHAPLDARFRLERRNRVVGRDDDDADFGYLELPRHDAERVKTYQKVFAGPQRIEVAAPADDLYVVSGFPKHRAVAATISGQSWVQLHCWTTSAAGYRTAPEAPPSLRADMRVLNLSLDPSALISDYVGHGDAPDAIKVKDTIDRMSGASGGPCWRTFAPTTAEDSWSTDSMKLVASHRATLQNVLVADGERSYSFAREVSIGHHLKMIAEDFPNLRDQILAAWPAVGDFPAIDTLRQSR